MDFSWPYGSHVWFCHESWQLRERWRSPVRRDTPGNFLGEVLVLGLTDSSGGKICVADGAGPDFRRVNSRYLPGRLLPVGRHPLRFDSQQWRVTERWTGRRAVLQCSSAAHLHGLAPRDSLLRWLADSAPAEVPILPNTITSEDSSGPLTQLVTHRSSGTLNSRLLEHENLDLQSERFGELGTLPLSC